MAYASEGAIQYSWPADVDMNNVATNQYTAVAVGPATNVQGSGKGGAAVVAYAAGNTFVGILLNAPRKGEGATVCLRGISRCRAASAWAVMDPLKVTDGGMLTKASSGDTVFGHALEAADPGDISTVLF